MKKLKITDPWIAKEKFEYILNVTQRLPYNKWTEYIDNHQDYFTWKENTKDGIYLKENIDKVPESFRKGTLEQLKKMQVFSEFNSKKGYYEVIISFNRELGTIGTTFQKPITEVHLRRLLDMANYLDAYLLNNGNEIIDEKVLDSFRS